MSLGTSIEWTDATWNPVRGCSKVSPGCKRCTPKDLRSAFAAFPATHLNKVSMFASCLRNCGIRLR